MPNYSFKCSSCGYEFSEFMSLSEYHKRKDSIECKKCGSSSEQILKPVRSQIEKRKEDLIVEIEDEVRKIVSKVKEGDEHTIRDIYGDRENKLKNN